MSDKYPFYIKAIIHITEINKEKHSVNFENFSLDFFNNTLEIEQFDLNDLLDFTYDLQVDALLELNPKIDECYIVLWNFEIKTVKSWTDLGEEYESEVFTNNLEFKLIDKEYTQELFTDIEKENQKLRTSTEELRKSHLE